MRSRALVLCALILAVGSALAEALRPVASVEFSGDIKAAKDLSAIGQIGDFLVIGSDEGTGKQKNENIVQLLQRQDADHYALSHDILLFRGNDKDGKEMDIEGIAVDGDSVYVIGSHSARRVKVKAKRKYAKNQQKFHDDQIDVQASRKRLYRLTLDSDGRKLKSEKESLRYVLSTHPALATFNTIPSKENGVDIEGIAVRDGLLYIGFRGPVFRDNWTPVLKTRFARSRNKHQLVYVDLDGLGIRDMAAVSNGFLILAGAVGDRSDEFRIYWWNGRDMLPGKDRKAGESGKLKSLGRIKPPADSKAEGLTVLDEQAGHYEVIVLYDGVAGGGAERFHVPMK